MPIQDPTFREESPLDLSQGIVGPESPSPPRVSFDLPEDLFPPAPYDELDPRQIGYLSPFAQQVIGIDVLSQTGKKLPLSAVDEIDFDNATNDLVFRDISGASLRCVFVNRLNGNPVEFPTPPVRRSAFKATPRSDPKLEKLLTRIAKLEKK